MLLLSKGLEISIESSLVSGLTHDHQDSLSSLLSTCFHSSGSVPQTLVTQLVRLAGLLGNEAPDTLGAAQRAVHSVVSALKSAVNDQGGDSGIAAGWISRISTVDKEILRNQSMLQKLAASADKSVVTKCEAWDLGWKMDNPCTLPPPTSICHTDPPYLLVILAVLHHFQGATEHCQGGVHAI